MVGGGVGKGRANMRKGRARGRIEEIGGEEEEVEVVEVD